MSLDRPNHHLRGYIRSAIGLGPIVALLLSDAVLAEPTGRKPQEAKPPELSGTLQQHDRQLEALRTEQRQAGELEAKLRAEIAAISADRRKLNSQLIETAARLRAVEDRIDAIQQRLKPLAESERLLRVSLEDRRSVIAEVLAALQRMGRRPPPMLLVRPDDALETVRGAILLAAALPEMRQETADLARDLAHLVRVRAEIASEHERLRIDFNAMAEERRRVALLTEERQRRQVETESALADTRRKALALAREADNLKDLIAKLEQGLDPAVRAARAAAGDAARTDVARIGDFGRLEPAVAFAQARGLLPLPVNGVAIREFGAPDGVGGSERGLFIATRSRAQVTAPCDGWVVYAGPFRSYGQLLILNAGGGYHVLLAGMERISVEIGQFVLTGEPVAVMGSGAQLAAILDAAANQPVLYVEFRKDGTPIDPGPWWAKSKGEKARG